MILSQRFRREREWGEGAGMANEDGVHFHADDIAHEILEELLEDAEPDQPTTPADIALVLNDFYGLHLTAEHVSAIRGGQLARDALTRLIQPMRTWPLVWDPPVG